MIVLVPIAFAAGVITVFTPCILPVLPIILAGGADTKRRPYAIAAGLVTTFTAFLLAGAWLWGLLGIGEQHQIQIGAVLLGLLAVTLIVPRIGEWLERPLSFLTRRRFGDAGGGFLLGAGLGLVFIPVRRADPRCADVERRARSGRRLARGHRARVCNRSGAADACYRRRQPPLRHELPPARSGCAHHRRRADGRCSGGDLQRLGRRPADQGASVRAMGAGRDRGQRDGQRGASSLKGTKTSASKYQEAPDIQGISAWINTPPLTMQELRGKVVLFDFWTYSCINCLRTLPYLKRWYDAYQDQGLVILGVHSPEFDFEHSPAMSRAVKRSASAIRCARQRLRRPGTRSRTSTGRRTT